MDWTAAERAMARANIGVRKARDEFSSVDRPPSVLVSNAGGT